MATGRLGNFAILATTNTTVYTAPIGTYAIANVNIVNRNAAAITIRLAMATTATPNAEEWIEWETIIIPNGVFERTGLVLNESLNIVVYADAANIGCTVYGIETSTS
jgi:hypothetical protein